MRDQRFVEDLRWVNDRLADSFSLCDFLGVTEREVMVFQTIRAAVRNLDTAGEPFSVRGTNVFASSGNGLINNGPAYVYLVDNGYCEEEERDGKTVIFPTRKLLDGLIAFLGRPRLVRTAQAPEAPRPSRP